ncbi:MAG: SpoIIE family protein phosphatase [candidate division Zixibacteria bacterium]|nr:SpoIIE family protein phosphatase [candidate division Zixibacteria bacterium]
MLKLIGTDENKYYSWELRPGKYIIGRKSTCDFHIADKTISRRHAELIVSDDESECFLSDLGSHNKTFVNGEEIFTKITIKAGDRIQFGQTDFKLQSAEDEELKALQKPTLFSDIDPEKSIMLSMTEALKPLPDRVADMPELLPTIFDMAKMLVLSEPKEAMLEHSLEMVGKLIPSDRLAVLLTTDKNMEMFTAACCTSSGNDPGYFSLSKTILKDILENKNAILIDDAKEDPRFAEKESIIASDLRSAMAVPLFDEERVFGILYADTTNPLRRYNDDFLRLFATMGNIIASRLANFALIQEREEKKIYEAELNRAADIQKSLVRQDIPKVSNYSLFAFQEQCRAVGGDLYDFTILPDGKLLFLLADVSGKGMGAALLMSNILASFRILYNNDEFNLNKAVTQVSLQMFKHSTTENFATLFIGFLDTQNHNLTYINAGHNPPLLIRESGKMDMLDPCGMMIGAFDFSTWTEESVEFNIGDSLTVFSDGVTEAGAEEEEYSDERLEQLVIENRDKTPKSLIRTIILDVNTFMGDSPRTDDITMIVIKRDK